MRMGMAMVNESQGSGSSRRRTFLKTVGTAGAIGLAGCTGGGGDQDTTTTTSTTTESSDTEESGETTTESESDGDGGGGGTITLGHLNPFSGGLGWIGANSRRGVATALQQVNDEGVLDGMSVETNEQDTETNPQAALSGFQTLASAGVPGIIGPSSSTMPNLVEPIQSEQIPLITVMAGTIQLDDVGGEWLYRNVPSDAVGGRASARYNYEEAGHRTMALAYKNDKGSQSFAAAAGNYFSNLGGEVVEEVPLAPNASSFRSEIQTLMDAEPDIVQMTAGTEVSSLFIKNYVEVGAGDSFNLTLGNDVLTEDFIDTVGADAIEGMIGQAPAPGPAYDQFAELHNEVNDTEPGTFAAESYDAVNQFCLAFQKHGSVERQAIPNELRNISNPPGTEVSTFAEGKQELENGNDINYTGAANPQNFDDNGNVLGPFSVLQAQDGDWQSVLTYSAEELSE